ncbi:thioesterase family protein [Halorussus sp. MSC15.2]|uniref:acyl-CoA thioesterase n=1 Tax=Halorussus sp. MSC15.2 TaxID=2283638 RepID=UPI0013D8DD23|nr:thioesterase family protein [Halorussus sp. MSC15.2]NEU56145.1 acyl-CoA thioesterase [Halorussus sp. MSC15.2]
MSDYSFTVDVDVRFQDLDTMGHVNNAVYATYFEQARVAYFEEVLDVPLHEVESVLANLEIDFRRPVEMVGEVTVGVRVTELGTTSIPMEYEVRADGEIAATGETVQVAVDSETGSSRPIPEAWREQIRDFEGL